MESDISSEISDAVELVKKSWRLYVSRWIYFLLFGLCFASVNEASNYFVGTLKKNPLGVSLLVNILITSWLSMIVLKFSIDLTEGRKFNGKGLGKDLIKIGRASCRERVCQYV